MNSPAHPSSSRAATDFAAVIFDMDGVIVDSEPRHEQAFYDVVRAIGLGDQHGLCFADYVGRSDHELWVDFLKRNRTSHSLEELLAMKRARVVEILRREKPLFDGVPELVARLAARCPLALASGSERPIVDTVLEVSGLARHFRATVSGSDITRGKPNPDIFLRAAGMLGVAPEDCWAIEDSKPGVAAARAAGMRVVAITNTHPAGELGHATHVARTSADIERLLLG